MRASEAAVLVLAYMLNNLLYKGIKNFYFGNVMSCVMFCRYYVK